MTWTKIKLASGVSVAMLLVGNLFFFSNNVGAAEFEVDGELTVQQINGDNKIILQESESFEVSVKDDKWFIVTTPHPGLQSQWAGMICFEIGGENNTIYQVSYFDKKILAPNSLNAAIGLIENDVVPENIAGSQIAELWLAFASSHYLDGAKNGKLKPIYWMLNPSMRNEDWEDTAKWERFDTAPHLPQEVVYFNENNIGINGTNRIIIQSPPPFEKGFTRAAYNVDSVTNIGGLMLPTGFTFKEFYVNRNTQPAELKVMRIVQANVAGVKTVCERTSFIPELTEATYVGDKRFARMPKPVEELSYMVTNGIWPAANVQWLQNMYQHELNARAHMIRPIESPSPRKKPGNTHTVLFVTLGGFAMATAAGILLLIARRRNSQN